MLPTLTARRYVQPLREGGSLPALVETDRGLEVVKFRGAGQGARALLAELIVGGIAQVMELPIPMVSVVELPEGFGHAEPDPEIQDILKGSVGANVGLEFVPGAFAYEHAAHADLIDPDLAADVVWLDALTTNIDRTPRNPNLLVAKADAGPQLFLIDHGAALYFHHNWASVDADRAQTPFPAIKDHVLLPVASSLEDADARNRPRLTTAVLEDVLRDIPDELLVTVPPGREPDFETAADGRRAYADYFAHRLSSTQWVEEAERARRTPPETSALAYRR